MNLIIGVDPGVSGAIAVFNFVTGKIVGLHDMPSYKTKVNDKDKRKVDAKKLREIFKPLQNDVLLTVIEDVGARPDDGSVSAFSFGFSTGIVHGAVAMFGWPVFKVRPQIWKSLEGLSSDKDLSRERARTFFPEIQSQLMNKKDHGRAEAAILARFGRRFLETLREDIFK